MDIQYQACGAAKIGAIKKTFDGAEHFGIETTYPEQALDRSEHAWIVIYDKYQLARRHGYRLEVDMAWPVGPGTSRFGPAPELFTLLQATLAPIGKIPLVLDGPA